MRQIAYVLLPSGFNPFLRICLCLLLALASSCKQQTTTPTASPSPSPQVSVAAELPPVIRTSETVIDFAQSILTDTQQNILFTPRGLAIGNVQTSAQLLSQPLPVMLDQVAPFLALSAKWVSVLSEQAKLTISVRASTDQQQWGEWQRSSLDGDPHTQAGLFFFPPNSKFIQYRLEMECDPAHHSPLVQSLKLRFISPGATLSQLRAATFLRRFQWNCPETKFQTKVQTANIRHLIVHHTATANDAQDWPAVVRTIWNFHAFTNGWRDLGYHYLIDPNGVIYEGRAGGDKAAGIHFSSANTGTLGIALLGNFTTERPSAQALESLKNLLARKSYERKLDPTGVSYHPSTSLLLPVIAGHQDANASRIARVHTGTHCPGEALYELLPTIRGEVKARLASRKEPWLEIPVH